MWMERRGEERRGIIMEKESDLNINQTCRTVRLRATKVHSSYHLFFIIGIFFFVDSACAFVDSCHWRHGLGDIRKRDFDHYRYIVLQSSSNFEIDIPNLEQERLTNRHYNLTILLPAYNEKCRIGNTLSAYMSYFLNTPVFHYYHHHHRQQQQQHQYLQNYTTKLVSGSVSFLVVDDGSTDGTADYIRDRTWFIENDATIDGEVTIQSNENCWKVDSYVHVITLPTNHGKGYAIERGMMELPICTNNDPSIVDDGMLPIVLVADADGSADISSIDSMLHRLEEILLKQSLQHPILASQKCGIRYPALVVGYRINQVPKSFVRMILSQGFRSVVSLIFLGCDLGVRDTQCGFKLMTVSTGKVLYDQLNLRRWTSDVEVIHRARMLDIPVVESGVRWVDKDGSKLIVRKYDAILVSLRMFGEIVNMRVQYVMGNWNVTVN